MNRSHIRRLRPAALVLLCIFTTALLLAGCTKSSKLLDHDSSQLPSGSVWLRKPNLDSRTELAGETLLDAQQCKTLFSKLQEGWTGEVLSYEPEGGFAEGLFQPYRIQFFAEKDPSLRDDTPGAYILIQTAPAQEQLKNTYDRTRPGGFADYDHAYGVYVCWSYSAQTGSQDLQDLQTAAFYPMSEESWQDLQSWLEELLRQAQSSQT